MDKQFEGKYVEAVAASKIGLRLADWREGAKLSLRNAAEQLGLSKSYYFKLENGLLCPNEKNLIDLEQRIGLTDGALVNLRREAKAPLPDQVVDTLVELAIVFKEHPDLSAPVRELVGALKGFPDQVNVLPVVSRGIREERTGKRIIRV